MFYSICVTAALLLTIPVLLILYFIRIPSYYTYKKIQLIQGPKGLPLIGLGLEIFRLQYSEILTFLCNYMKQYPGVAKGWLLGIPLVFVSKPQHLEIIMGSTQHIQKGFEYHYLTSWLNEGLLTSKGEKWHFRRKLLTPAFHFKILENNLVSLNKHSRDLIRNLTNNKDKPVDVMSLISLYTVDVICETAMGSELQTQKDKGKRYLNSIKTVSKLIITRLLNIYLKDWMFNLLPLGKSFNTHLTELHKYTENIIRERKALYQNNLGNKHGKRQAFLDMLIELENSKKGSLTDLDIREEVDTFMFEGHDTTAAALTFAIFLLGTHLDVQERAYQEQIEIFGEGDRAVTLQDIQGMTYLDKIIKETLRLFPSVPYFSRELTQDVMLDNQLVPKGSNVIILAYQIHRNPEVFPDPELFDPERFAPDEVAKRHPFSYIPFSAGPRNCIGQKFAMMEMKVVLSSILRYCKLSSVTQRKDLVLIPFLILKNQGPILVNISLRKPTQSFEEILTNLED